MNISQHHWPLNTGISINNTIGILESMNNGIILGITGVTGITLNTNGMGIEWNTE